MSPSTPDWIRALKSQDEADAAKKRVVEQREQLEGLLLRNEGPGFWASLQRELAIAVEALSVIGLDGFVPPIGGDYVRVEVRKLGISANQTYSDLSYRCGDPAIRCTPMAGNGFSLFLSSNPDSCGLGVIPERSEKLLVLDAAAAARLILQPMVTIVRSRAGFV